MVRPYSLISSNYYLSQDERKQELDDDHPPLHVARVSLHEGLVHGQPQMRARCRHALEPMPRCGLAIVTRAVAVALGRVHVGGMHGDAHVGDLEADLVRGRVRVGVGVGVGVRARARARVGVGVWVWVRGRVKVGDLEADQAGGCGCKDEVSEAREAARQRGAPCEAEEEAGRRVKQLELLQRPKVAGAEVARRVHARGDGC